MRTSRAGLDVIMAFEGFRPRYEELPDGRLIIGYGHVRKTREGVRVSREEAEAILREYDLPPVERYVLKCVLAPLSQSEFDALVSLAFSIGAKAFASSDVVAYINSGNRLAAASAFDHWRRARIGGRVQIVDALVRRRAAEKALFLTIPGNTPIASSRVYRALHDSSGLLAPPQKRDILVERYVEAPSEAGGHTPEASEKRKEKPTSKRTATEEAAESVRRQMVRILGEDGEKVTDGPELMPRTETDGASPEEITAAVSELAGDTANSAPRRSVWPQREDLPPPPLLLRKSDEDAKPLRNGAAARRVKIDDLEEPEVSPERLAEVIEETELLEAEQREGRFLSALPYGLLSLIGAGLGGYGFANQFGLVQSERTLDSELAIYLPPFLILLGGLLFVVMAYYFLRTLLSDG